MVKECGCAPVARFCTEIFVISCHLYFIADTIFYHVMG